MKKLLNTILLLALLLCYNSCVDSRFIYEQEETPIEESVIVTTGAATDITSVSATVSGYVEELIVEDGTNVEIGVVYSNTDSIPNIDNGISVKSDSNTEGIYTVSLTGLSDDATYFYRSYVKTDNNTYYGKVESFTTRAIIVTTGAVTDITSASATVSGNVENLAVEEGDNVIIGVVYSETDTIPSIEKSNIVKSDNKADGDFTVSLADLTDGATYFYRSYVIADDKVYYGEVSMFTTKSIIVTTGVATDITGMSAIISGSVENLVTEEGANVIIGIVYSNTETIPSVENSLIVKSDNIADGEFTVSLADLNDGATYYYRTYVIADDKVYYGRVSTFTTKNIIVTTGAASDITSISATVSGSVSNLAAGITDVEIGVVYSENNNRPSIENGITVKSDSYTNGDFTISIADLWNGITYYYRTYVKIADKVYYGDVMSFMTQNVIVTTGTVTNITGMSAKISGNVENIEALGAGYFEIGIAYSRNNTLDDCEFVLSEQSTNGDFSVTITNLSRAVTYYYCAYVKKDFEYYYGEVLSFTTKDEITSGQEVDLGLSVKWAGWNVGATSPEQYGGYYAWGETEEKSDYSEQTYIHYNDSIGYVNIGENISGTQYDVATAKWGNGWRMPTKAELEELNSKCRFDVYSYKGVTGVKVTGPNGNAIFFPCAGECISTTLDGAGYFSRYWSDSLYEYSSYSVWYLYVDYNSGHDMCDSSRYYGLSVRPVRDY